ncbi:MAG: hypothetical protein HYY16_18135 [Planctomycetes bacterium]|nr:hypothetical protein [Planctomycetota bacterium]
MTVEEGAMRSLLLRSKAGIEQFVHLPASKRTSGDAVFVYDVRLGAEVESVTLAPMPDGYLELRGKDNRAWLRLHRPDVFVGDEKVVRGILVAQDQRARPSNVLRVDIPPSRRITVSVIVGDTEADASWIRCRWTATDRMAVGRERLAMARLEDGRVLAACGANTVPLCGCEIFDPVGETWTSTASLPLGQARAHVTLTPLPDGKVLLCGGDRQWTGSTFKNGFVWDPGGDGVWTPVVNAMSTGRSHHQAVLLRDGRVLILGGGAKGGTDREVYAARNGCSLYDPTTRSFLDAASMSESRLQFGAELLADGTVLVAGGRTNRRPAEASDVTSSCEVYLPDSGAGRWIPVNPLPEPRHQLALIRLSRGEVMAITAPGCWLFSDGKWRNAIPVRECRDCFALSTVLVSRAGEVVIQAGGNSCGPTDKVYRYEAARWTGPREGEPLMNERRDCAAAVRLEEGKLLIAGGRPDDSGLVFNDSTEVYEDTAGANLRPASPVALEQVQEANGAIIADGAVVSEARIEFRARVDDPDGGQVCLQVEMEPVSRDFDGAGLLTGSPVERGGTASVRSPVLTPGVSYHWRARGIDLNESAGAWVEFEADPFEPSDFTRLR